MDTKFNPSSKEKRDIQQYFHDIKLLYLSATGIIEPRTWPAAPSPRPSSCPPNLAANSNKTRSASIRLP
jgi:hypothetical protein